MHTHIHANARVSLFAHVTEGKRKENERKMERNGCTFLSIHGRIRGHTPTHPDLSTTHTGIHTHNTLTHAHTYPQICNQRPQQPPSNKIRPESSNFNNNKFFRFSHPPYWIRHYGYRNFQFLTSNL